MNFAHSQVIRSGPRAGMPRPISDTIIDGITAAREIAIKLKRQGATVIGVDVGDGRPAVQIVAGRLTQDLQEHDIGVVWKTSTVRGLPERHGQAKVQTDDGREVLIVWVERGQA